MKNQIQKGAYVLIINLPVTTSIVVGKLGEINFRSGWYTYVGSAMRGFNSRLPHHLRHNQKSHWHIDYLLQAASVKQVVTYETDIKMECEIAQALTKDLICIKGFGCSDCRCVAHLFNAKTLTLLASSASRLVGQRLGRFP